MTKRKHRRKPRFGKARKVRNTNPGKGALAELRRRLRCGLTLTHGERLALWRRAKGHRQGILAGVFGVGQDRYRQWEEDIGDVPRVKGVRLADLPLAELCWLRRRRLGLTQTDIAKVLDKSPPWLRKAEQGGPGADVVVDFLEKRMEQEEGFEL